MSSKAAHTVFLLSLALSLALAGCEYMAPGAAAPKYHAWSYIESIGDEPSGYGMYSYVFAGRPLDSDQSHSRRYAALIASIKGVTPEGQQIEQTEIPRGEVNIFMIPTGSSDQRGNQDISKILATLMAATDQRFRRPGPFIVSLYHPIRAASGESNDMLFADLTNTRVRAIPDLVRIYKNRVSETELAGIEKLKSLRLSLLNSLLIAEESIGFATAAYADAIEVLPDGL